jgi:acetoin utilization deacetylase AcuC-like enzyme
MDPLSATMVTAKGFRSITRRLLKAADELTGGKIVFIQEGAMLRSWVALLTAD